MAKMNGYKGWSSPVYDAVVAAFLVSIALSVLYFLEGGILQALLGAVLMFFVASPVVGAAVLAWHNGCRVSVVPSVLLFVLLSIPDKLSPGIGRFYSDIPFIPVYFFVFLIGTEWAIRERGKVVDFLRSVPGVVSMAVGVAHAVIGMVVQIHARPRLLDGLFEIDGPRLLYELYDVVFVIGIFFILIALLVVVVLPVFLWRVDRLLAPVAVITGWVFLGSWLNYLWWDAHPVNPIRGLGAVFPPFLPAPDYAAQVYVPLLLILLTAIFEIALRETDFKNRWTSKLAQS